MNESITNQGSQDGEPTWTETNCLDWAQPRTVYHTVCGRHAAEINQHASDSSVAFYLPGEPEAFLWGWFDHALYDLRWIKRISAFILNRLNEPGHRTDVTPVSWKENHNLRDFVQPQIVHDAISQNYFVMIDEMLDEQVYSTEIYIQPEDDSVLSGDFPASSYTLDDVKGLAIDTIRLLSPRQDPERSF